MSTLICTETWTTADLDKLPQGENGCRYELFDGELVVTPSPVPFHQLVAYRLSRWLGDHVERNRLGQMFFAPVDVKLAAGVTFVPDLLFVRADRLGIVGATAIEGAPDLVVEILSPSTRGRDVGEKMALYARFGIAEYWIVDPVERAVTIHTLRGDRYEPVEQGGASARSVVLPGLVIDVAALFAATAR